MLLGHLVLPQCRLFHPIFTLSCLLYSEVQPVLERSYSWPTSSLKPSLFSMYMYIFNMKIWHQFCLLSTQFGCVIIHTRNVECHVQISDGCAPIRISNTALFIRPILQAPQLQRAKCCRELPDDTNLSMFADKLVAFWGLNLWPRLRTFLNPAAAQGLAYWTFQY